MSAQTPATPRIKVCFGEHDGEPGDSLLFRVGFAPDSLRPRDRAERIIETGLCPLAAAGVPEVRAEDWLSAAPTAHGRDGDFHYAHDDALCCGWSYLDADAPLEEATRAAYVNGFRALGELGFPGLLRAWHYLPNLHGEEAGMSRYVRFCRGRFGAFESMTPPLKPERYCAATVIGTRASFGVIYFLAARETGTAVENPRQTSAWHYPLPDAQERPLFARAVHKTWKEGRPHFYVSGTAGIVGHRSRHPGDIGAQLHEALLNLRALLDATPGEARLDEGERSSLLKVYVARPDDADAALRALDESEFAFGPLALFQGEICRRELRVEVEALIV